MRRVLRCALILGALACLPATAPAQELACTVTTDISQLEGSDYQYLQRLPERLMDFLNNERWTQDVYQEHERITCNIRIIFEQALSTYTFRTRAIISTQRPVYGVPNQMKVVDLLDDDWQFTYTDGQALQFDVNRYDPLASVLAFYAYVILGYDYDTFRELGGTRHFQMARRIADKAQGEGQGGWQQIGNEPGRYTLITQITDPRYEPLRRAYYTHHFGGLDHFALEPDAARTRVLEAIQSLEALYDEVGEAYVLDLFFNAKANEFVGMFQRSPLAEDAYALLADLDPSNLTQYQGIVN